MSNPNANCLEGKRCPRCRSYGDFQVWGIVRARFLLTDDGTAEEDECHTELGHDETAVCCECGYEDPWRNFNDPDAEEKCKTPTE